jgi:hypothetical protein
VNEREKFAGYLVRTMSNILQLEKTEKEKKKRGKKANMIFGISICPGQSKRKY